MSLCDLMALLNCEFRFVQHVNSFHSLRGEGNLSMNIPLERSVCVSEIKNNGSLHHLFSDVLSGTKLIG